MGDVLTYEYDFGDGWEHTVALEAIEEMKDWLPPGWTPEAFDLDETNAFLPLLLSGWLQAVVPDAVAERWATWSEGVPRRPPLR